MRYPIFSLRISDDCKRFLDEVKSEYGADDGINRLIEAIGKFCTTGQSEIDGINVRQFFEDALSGRLVEAGTRKAALRAAEERAYSAYSEFMKSDFGSSILVMMCEKNTAAEFFSENPNYLNILQEQFLISSVGCAIRISDVRKYTARWYQERIEDGSAAEYLKDNIKERNKKRRGEE